MKKISIIFALLISFSAFSQNSVLSSGQWYKISVAKKGIYKIDHSFLQSIGINVSAIDPQTIRIFSNGGAMLPESNSAFRYDDLVENPIYVFGENDGVFDLNDYVLFYGQSPDKIYWDQVNQNFFHKKNLYSDSTFYFINVGSNAGKRIAAQDTSSAVIDYNCNSFFDFQFYENDSLSFLKRGKNWYGENFNSNNTSKNFAFKFPNRIITEPVKIKASVLARCITCSSSFDISANGNFMNNLTCGLVPSVYYGEYATTASVVLSNTIFGSDLVNMNLNYIANGTSEGWLNYLEVSTKRQLTQSGSQMNFIYNENIGNGLTTNFVVNNVSNQHQIWDISNPLNPFRQNINYSNGIINFKILTDSIKEFISFDGNQFLTPVFSELINNQNLHALAPANYIVVTHPDFINQANQLVNFHYVMDGFSGLVVTTTQIYNEFSSGTKDPIAIRDFLRYLYNKPGGNSTMKYLQLLGDATYDYKNRIANNRNFVPTFESENSLSPTGSYITDDFYCMLDSLEGINPVSADIDIAVGRLAVNNPFEAQNVVDKIINYKNFQASKGEWRENIILSCDDEGYSNLYYQSEHMANYIDTAYCEYNIEKIYLNAFQKDTTTSPATSPIARDSLYGLLNDKGALIFMFDGIIGNKQFSVLKVLDSTLMTTLNNKNHLPFIYLPHSDGDVFTNPARLTNGEFLTNMNQNGAIAVLAPTGITYFSYNEESMRIFWQYAMEKQQGSWPTLGDIYKKVKTESSPSVNRLMLSLIGDPALKLNYPENKVEMYLVGDSVNTNNELIISPGTQNNITGSITDANGNLLNSFNGKAYVRIMGAKNNRTNIDATNPSPHYFQTYEDIVFDSVYVVNGTFAYNFIAPSNLSFYTNKSAKIIVYARSNSTDAIGCNASVKTVNYPNALNEKLYFNNTFNLFPNPTEGIVNITVSVNRSSQYILSIYDSKGTLTHEEKLNLNEGIFRKQLDLSGYSKGIYAIRISSNEGSFIKTIVIQ